MTWICTYFGHKPEREGEHYREQYPLGTVSEMEWKDQYHHERYTKCVRCKEEITYITWANVWLSKAECVKRNMRRWLENDETTKVS